MKNWGIRIGLSLSLKAVLVGLVAYGVGDSFLDYDVFPLRYFTILSNILVAAVTLYLMVKRNDPRLNGSDRLAYLRGVSLLAISVTGIVYHLLLAPAGGMTFVSHVLHTIVPLGYVADWLLFDSHGTFRLRHVAVWVACPLAYVPLTLALALIDGFYPYSFMDVTELGYGGVLLNVLGLAVAFAVLGALYVGIDRLLALGPRLTPHRAEASCED